MKVKYNAPVVLTFTLTCLIIVILSFFIPGIQVLFSCPGRTTFDSSSILDYLRLFLHIFGHADLNHFLSNFAFILLLGPILEASYGKGLLMLMGMTTALVTGILNVLLFNTGLMGASGIVFMMILLISFTNISKGEIPLTFILIVVIYLGREIVNAFQTNSVSEFAHIIGGICGSIFGYLRPAKS
ncbi:MAG TPA: rhomboid family intramembrane serine protease [Spirochaetia bacterium]|nr:rhomboid family intramembrane serine protease [Spirochaetales bacterium]HRS65797.1 rhomboid family intramembrane serine protease [Spirochaetia bacterium]HOT59170.1 rhomboid family intramembrane serine protease [Spirochaetales bacterium]HPD81285.1 rhomboid family intramembrane serine protease [Spirochaetales bacterium]HQG39375.1 rhomboid family intramembrane serine protease [Spirochaetales bacterium]